MNRKHTLLMVLCCLIPLVGFAAISIFRIPANTVIYTGLALLCPVMHLLMMKGMTHAPARSQRPAAPQRFALERGRPPGGSAGVGHNHDDAHHQVEAPKELKTQ